LYYADIHSEGDHQNAKPGKELARPILKIDNGGNKMNTKQSLLTILVAIVAVMLLSSCSPKVAQENQGSSVSDTILLSNRLLSEAEDARDFCIQSVLAIMKANGGNRITTGTYRLNATGTGEYTSTPDDRLLVVLPDERKIEMIIQAFDGKMSGDIEQFLANPYQLNMIVTAPGMDKLTLIATQLYNGPYLQMTGSVQLDNQNYQVRLTQQTPTAGLNAEEANGNYRWSIVQGVISLGENTFPVDAYVPASLASENNPGSQKSGGSTSPETRWISFEH
jgi:hypothetical protein